MHARIRFHANEIHANLKLAPVPPQPRRPLCRLSVHGLANVGVCAAAVRVTPSALGSHSRILFYTPRMDNATTRSPIWSLSLWQTLA